MKPEEINYKSSASVRHAIEKLNSALTLIDSEDLDRLSAAQLASAISELQTFVELHDSMEELSSLLQLVRTIISHLYVARGYATLEVPRSIDYYSHMLEVKQLGRQIKNLK